MSTQAHRLSDVFVSEHLRGLLGETESKPQVVPGVFVPHGQSTVQSRLRGKLSERISMRCVIRQDRPTNWPCHLQAEERTQRDAVPTIRGFILGRRAPNKSLKLRSALRTRSVERAFQIQRIVFE